MRSLTKCIDNWKLITDDVNVLEAISNFRIPFLSRPVQVQAPSPFNFGKEQLQFAKKEVNKLLGMGAIVEVESCEGQFVSRIFLVPKKDSGLFRLIINLKKLNEYVDSPHFKMEDHRSVLNF